MSAPTEERVIDAVEAARLIFNTREPSPDQVEKVEAEIERGILRRSRQGGLTTTAEAVAELFASRATKNLVAHVAPSEKPAAKRPTGSAAPDEVTSVYQTMLKDYFLGIFLQRQSRPYSGVFGWSVLAGQIVFILALLGVFFWAFSDANGLFSFKSPQQIAVEKWITAKHGPYEILSISQGVADTDLIVKFRYRAKSGKPIETQQVFRVEEGNVSLVVNE